jgi:hypothetical protein
MDVRAHIANEVKSPFFIYPFSHPQTFPNSLAAAGLNPPFTPCSKTPRPNSESPPLCQTVAYVSPAPKAVDAVFRGAVVDANGLPLADIL